MGRKPKRVRDPNRSHGRASVVVPPVRRQPAHGSVALEGHGWRCGHLSAPVLEELCGCLRHTKLDGKAFAAFTSYGQQGNDDPLRQRELMGTPLWSALWKGPVLAALRDMSDIMCPQCGESVNAHEIKACDLNVLKPGAACWPHLDLFDNVGIGSFVAMNVLLQPAAGGGLFRVAREAGEGGVAWRLVGDDGHSFARAQRDSVLVPLFESGDVCVFSGGEMAHGVGKVYGESRRVTLLVTLKCRSL